jgi:hAT family C-terminal dimerisation region
LKNNDINLLLIFFVILDNAMEQLRQRFDKSAQGLHRYLGLEQVLLTGKTDSKLVSQYPELDVDALDVQLKMFRSQFTCKTLKQAQVNLQAMCPEVRSLFSQIEQLVRLLLVCPASSCTAERSFSALRRLKTWLRNNMTQKRLNHVSVCHVHQAHLDSIDLFTLADEFAQRSEIRRNLFGLFSLAKQQ